MIETGDGGSGWRESRRPTAGSIRDRRPLTGASAPPAAARPPLLRWGRSPFAPLDEAVWWLDSADEPWSVHLEARVEGRLDEVRLREAVLVALDRHPRAWARLVPARRRRQRHEWEVPPAPDVDLFDAVECPDEGALAAARAQLESRPVPLAASPPLRLRLVHRPGGDVIILNLHHVAGDGISALALLRSIARAYSGGDDLEPDGGPEQIGLAGSGRAVGSALAELARASRRSVHLVADGGDGRPGFGFGHLALSSAETQSLVQWTRRVGVTVNDALLAAIHVAAGRWNADHGAPGGRVSVLMPMNLRPNGQASQVVGNFSFMVPVTTAAVDRAVPSVALQVVARSTRRIKASGAPATLVRLLRLLQHLPVQAKRAAAALVTGSRFAPTTLLSNLGRVDDRLDFGPGGGTVTELWFTPPVRMPVGLAMGVVTANGRLHLGFRYRHPLLGEAQMAEFCRYYQDALAGLRKGGPGAASDLEQAA